MPTRKSVIIIPPSYGTVEGDRDCYLHQLDLRNLARTKERSWRFHLQPTTVALAENRYAKSLHSFTAHRDEQSFRELLRECAFYDCPRPSGYADPFHKHFQSPRLPYTINIPFRDATTGGWQAAPSPGRHFGTFYKYDMVSAYLWAMTLGLPDPSTYVRSKDPFSKRHSYDGLYRVRLLRPSLDAPFPFNVARICLATNAEIQTYGLAISEVLDGVRWNGLIDGWPLVQQILQFSFWKYAARAYWGRWHQVQRVQCITPNKKWYLPNPALNIPWSHVIVSRVKMKMWEFATRAVHVYVDSVITPERLPEGNGLGDWKLEHTYERGVFIRAPGQYGDIDEGTLERMAGVPKDSPLRNSAYPVEFVPPLS